VLEALRLVNFGAFLSPSVFSRGVVDRLINNNRANRIEYAGFRRFVKPGNEMSDFVTWALFKKLRKGKTNRYHLVWCPPVKAEQIFPD